MSGFQSKLRYQKILSATDWHLPSTSVRIQLCAADLQYSLKRVQGGKHTWGTLCSGKNWQGRSSDTQIFSETNFMSPILVSRKTLKSFMVGTAPHNWCKLHKTSRNLLEKCVLDCMYLFSPKSHIYWPPPTHPLTPAFGEVSQSYLRGCLTGCSPHFAPDRT